jgi:DNA-binding NtrC family response regulator
MRVSSRAVRRALVASEDPELRAFVAGVVRSLGLAATEARGLREAVMLLSSRPDVLLFGTELVSAGSFELVDAANQARPVPIRIAIGPMGIPEDAFELARRGIARLLPRPPAPREIAAAIRETRTYDTTALFADLVGGIKLAGLMAEVREAMTTQALALTGGNRGAAARLLGISRQAIHQALRRENVDASLAEPMGD